MDAASDEEVEPDRLEDAGLEILHREDDEAMESSPRPTDVSLRIRCPNCGHSLSLLAGRTQLTFHCRSGHTFPMRQLFQTQSQEVNRGLRAVVEVWEEKALLLRKIVAQARQDRRPDLAVNFEREVDQIEIRLQSLRDHLRNVNGESGSGSAAG